MHSIRQNQIIEESIKLIHTQGIQGMTIKNISNSIGLTEAAIYRHFKSKDEIISTILDDFRLDLEMTSQSILKSDSTAVDMLKNILGYMVDRFCDKPYLTSVIFSDEIFKNRQALSNKIGQLIKQNNEYFKLIIEKGQNSEEIRNDIDANDLAIIFMGSFRMVIKNWQLSNQVYSLKTKGNDIFKSLFKIISIS
ncbi:MAG: TetR/AcrR family transcriptional regulator [Bacteroidales bacterium]|jgi:AcrR family transcriptional regulator|nr:TetR/AcrR family transcriptional regulator [Bacteroidales bacterium]